MSYTRLPPALEQHISSLMPGEGRPLRYLENIDSDTVRLPVTVNNGYGSETTVVITRTFPDNEPGK